MTFDMDEGELEYEDMDLDPRTTVLVQRMEADESFLHACHTMHTNPVTFGEVYKFITAQARAERENVLLEEATPEVEAVAAEPANGKCRMVLGG